MDRDGPFDPTLPYRLELAVLKKILGLVARKKAAKQIMRDILTHLEAFTYPIIGELRLFEGLGICAGGVKIGPKGTF